MDDIDSTEDTKNNFFVEFKPIRSLIKFLKVSIRLLLWWTP